MLTAFVRRLWPKHMYQTLPFCLLCGRLEVDFSFFPVLWNGPSWSNKQKQAQTKFAHHVLIWSLLWLWKTMLFFWLFWHSCTSFVWGHGLYSEHCRNYTRRKRQMSTERDGWLLWSHKCRNIRKVKSGVDCCQLLVCPKCVALLATL